MPLSDDDFSVDDENSRYENSEAPTTANCVTGTFFF